MVLAIDLDNCLFDTAATMRGIWDLYCGTRIGDQRLDFGRRDETRYDWGSPAGIAWAIDFIERHDGYANLPPFERAVDTIQLLYLMGVRLHFVSDRPYRVWDATLRAFAKHKLADENLADRANDYGQLWICGGQKAAHLAELRATERLDTLVDDDPATLLAAEALGLRAIVYDQPWNRGLPARLERAVGWKGRRGLADLLGVAFKEGNPRAAVAQDSLLG